MMTLSLSLTLDRFEFGSGSVPYGRYILVPSFLASRQMPVAIMVVSHASVPPSSSPSGIARARDTREIALILISLCLRLSATVVLLKVDADHGFA